MYIFFFSFGLLGLASRLRHLNSVTTRSLTCVIATVTVGEACLSLQTVKKSSSGSSVCVIGTADCFTKLASKSFIHCWRVLLE